MSKFDAKSFNERAFGVYMNAVPNVKLNKLRESRAIVADQRLRETFVNNGQTGTVYAVLPYGSPLRRRGKEQGAGGRMAAHGITPA